MKQNVFSLVSVAFQQGNGKAVKEIIWKLMFPLIYIIIKKY